MSAIKYAKNFLLFNGSLSKLVGSCDTLDIVFSYWFTLSLDLGLDLFTVLGKLF